MFLGMIYESIGAIHGLLIGASGELSGDRRLFKGNYDGLCVGLELLCASSESFCCS